MFKRTHVIRTPQQKLAFDMLRVEAELRMHSRDWSHLRAMTIRYCALMDEYHAKYGDVYLEGTEWDNRRRELT